MKSRMMSERGFTLVELLTVTVIIGTLMGISLQTFQVVREGAYDTGRDELIRQAQVALEAGHVELQDRGPAFYSVWTTTPGPVRSFGGENFAPGLILPERSMIFLYYNGFCAENMWGPWCIVSGGAARDCRTNNYRWWNKFNDGTEITFVIDAGWAC